LILVLSLWSCLSEISLEVPETNSESIAIRGKLIYGDTSRVSVKITNVSDFTASDVPRAIEGATVELVDESGQRIELFMGEVGIYERIIPGSGTYTVEPGRNYQLSVRTPEGKTYLSLPETLKAVPEPDGIRPDTIRREILNDVGNLVNQPYLRFLITTPLTTTENGERAYLKWNFTGTYRFTESNLTSPFPNTRTCYFTDVLDLEHVVVFNGRESEQEILNDFLLLEEELDYRFSEGFYLTAVQESLSEGAYRYWQSAGEIVSLTGNFFDAPPGKINSNLYNPEDLQEEVFGYFYATQQDTLRLYVPPGPDPVRRFCPLEAAPGDDSVSPVCLDCNSRHESTLEKPDFWEE
jgi:hypothetical protein